MMRQYPDSRPSENHIVRMLRKHFGRRSAILEQGIGDDAAVLRLPGSKEKWVFTTDMLLEDIDFRRDWQTPEQLGWRALAVNFSDLAAMGARPRFYTVALGLPEEIGEKWIAAFYRGMASLGDRYRAMLIGGDLSRSASGVHITITAAGESLRRKVLYRSGGRIGDALYVTGMLGAAAAGLRILEQGRTRGRTDDERYALERHRRPEPRCAAGLWLAQSGFAGAMMDLSDGLSMDLPRLCDASVTGAEIFLWQIPVFPASSAWGCDPMEQALHGAEEFELLFSVRAEKIARFEADYPRRLSRAHQIGRLTKRRGIVCIGAPGKRPRPLPELGFDHFRKHRAAEVRSGRVFSRTRPS